MQSKALEAVARVFCCGDGECQHPDACYAPMFVPYAHLAIAAFLAKLHEDTDPDDTARYCLLAQLAREVSDTLPHGPGD